MSNYLLLVAAVVLCLGISQAQAGGRDYDILEKYAKLKVFDSCFGYDVNRAYMKRKTAAKIQCMKMPVKDVTGTGDASASIFDGQAEGSTQTRRKRSPASQFQYYDEPKIRSLVSDVQAMISNFTCRMQQMGYMDESNQIQLQTIFNTIDELGRSDDTLREEMKAGITDCYAKKDVVPTTDLNLPYKPAMFRAKTFLQCADRRKRLACLKKEMRGRTEPYGSDPYYSKKEEKMIAEVIWKETVGGADDIFF